MTEKKNRFSTESNGGCPECGSETYNPPMWGPHIEKCDGCGYWEWFPAKPEVTGVSGQ